MITNFNQFLNEGISEVIYHRTWLTPLVRILKSGKILLSTTIHTTANSYSKEGYYLSFSRTKNTNLGYLKSAQVVIEFDGKKLETKYNAFMGEEYNKANIFKRLKEYYQPSHISSDGSKYWFLNDIQYSEEDFEMVKEMLWAV